MHPKKDTVARATRNNHRRAQLRELVITARDLFISRKDSCGLARPGSRSKSKVVLLDRLNQSDSIQLRRPMEGMAIDIFCPQADSGKMFKV